MKFSIYQSIQTFIRVSPGRGAAVGAVALVLVASLPAVGLAQERSPHLLRLEGAAAASLDDGESIGGGFGGGYEYRILDSLGIAGSFVGDLFPDEEAGVPDNTASYRGPDGRRREVEADGVMYPSTKLRYYGVGVGPRLHALAPGRAVDLWLGTGLKYVRLRDESRVGLDVGLGADVSFGDGGLAVGSFVRYTQVLQPGDDASSSGDDDRFLQFGAALSWGGAGKSTARRVLASESEPERENEPAFEAEVEPEPAIAAAAEVEPEPATTPEPTEGDTGALHAAQGTDGIPEAAPATPAPATHTPAYGQGMDLPTRVAFGLGAKTVTARGARNLREVLKVLRSDASIRTLQVVGHADDRGSDEVNEALSTERAQAVVDWLVAQGVEADRLKAVGRGAREPRAYGQTNKARRANRRVEFVVSDSASSP